MTKTKLSAALRAAFPHTIPIMTGYLAVGLAYGVLMASKGYNALWSGFQRLCLLRQYAVRGHHAADLRL